MVLFAREFLLIRGGSLFSRCRGVYFQRLISFIKDNEYDGVCVLYSLS